MSAISAATLGRVFMSSGVAPIRALRVPKGCSAVSRRTRMASGFLSSRRSGRVKQDVASVCPLRLPLWVNSDGSPSRFNDSAPPQVAEGVFATARNGVLGHNRISWIRCNHAFWRPQCAGEENLGFEPFFFSARFRSRPYRRRSPSQWNERLFRRPAAGCS